VSAAVERLQLYEEDEHCHDGKFNVINIKSYVVNKRYFLYMHMLFTHEIIFTEAAIDFCISECINAVTPNKL